MTTYNELYLDDAMNNLGDMVGYAVCDLGFDPGKFFGWFIFSGIAANLLLVIGDGNIGLAGYLLILQIK